MSEQTLQIIKQNGESFMISSQKSMYVLAFLSQSPFFEAAYQKVDGQHGEIDAGGQFAARPIKAKIFFRSYDIFDFYLVRNLIFALFASQEEFYVISSREPGKRWLVRVSSTYEIEPQQGKLGVFEVNFKSAFTFSESVGTTQDPFTFEAEKWQFGMNLPTDVELIYSHSVQNFKIYNASDVTLDPRSPHMHLEITFKGESTGLTIKNKTTGDTWNYDGETLANDTILLEDVRSFKNGASIFKYTNRKVISLLKGWNDFEITGATGAFLIEFNFRFYYF